MSDIKVYGIARFHSSTLLLPRCIQLRSTLKGEIGMRWPIRQFP